MQEDDIIRVEEIHIKDESNDKRKFGPHGSLVDFNKWEDLNENELTKSDAVLLSIIKKKKCSRRFVSFKEIMERIRSVEDILRYDYGKTFDKLDKIPCCLKFWCNCGSSLILYSIVALILFGILIERFVYVYHGQPILTKVEHVSTEDANDVLFPRFIYCVEKSDLSFPIDSLDLLSVEGYNFCPLETFLSGAVNCGKPTTTPYFDVVKTGVTAKCVLMPTSDTDLSGEKEDAIFLSIRQDYTSSLSADYAPLSKILMVDSDMTDDEAIAYMKKEYHNIGKYADPCSQNQYTFEEIIYQEYGKDERLEYTTDVTSFRIPKDPVPIPPSYTCYYYALIRNSKKNKVKVKEYKEHGFFYPIETVGSYLSIFLTIVAIIMGTEMCCLVCSQNKFWENYRKIKRMGNKFIELDDLEVVDGKMGIDTRFGKKKKKKKEKKKSNGKVSPKETVVRPVRKQEDVGRVRVIPQETFTPSRAKNNNRRKKNLKNMKKKKTTLAVTPSRAKNNSNRRMKNMKKKKTLGGVAVTPAITKTSRVTRAKNNNLRRKKKK